jgi:hypothetical protein
VMTRIMTIPTERMPNVAKGRVSTMVSILNLQ